MAKKTSGTELFIVDNSDQDWKVREYQVHDRPAGKESTVAHSEFKKADIDARQALYLEMAKQVWDPSLIQAELEDN